jgi:hypothetical protein
MTSISVLPYVATLACFGRASAARKNKPACRKRVTATTNIISVMLLGALLPAAAAAQVAGAASASEERRFTTIWLVQPSDAPLGPRTIEDNDYVFRQRLLPPTLIRLTADVADPEDGHVMAAAGTQMFGLLTSGPPLFCKVGRKDPSVARTLLLGGGNRQACYADMDRNGTLDGQFSVGNAVKGLPNISGKRPKVPKPVSGGAYERIDPNLIDTPYFVGVRYEGMVGLLSKKRPAFRIWFGTDESRDSLTSFTRPPKGSEQPVVQVLGAEFTVVAMRGETLDIDIHRAIPPQPFGVVRTVTYSYY